VREQERRDAYNRCVERGGTDCDDLLHHDWRFTTRDLYVRKPVQVQSKVDVMVAAEA
jgi:hypothetical protein